MICAKWPPKESYAKIPAEAECENPPRNAKANPPNRLFHLRVISRVQQTDSSVLLLIRDIRVIRGTII